MARNHEDLVLRIFTSLVSCNVVEAAEAVGILKATEGALEEDWGSIFCESDAKIVISSLNSTDWTVVHWAQNLIKKILALKFSFCSMSFVWILKLSNRLVHALRDQVLAMISEIVYLLKLLVDRTFPSRTLLTLKITPALLGSRLKVLKESCSIATFP